MEPSKKESTINDNYKLKKMTTEKAKEFISENKAVRWFLRGLSGVILMNFTAYIVYHLWANQEIPMTSAMWWILLGCLALWAAWEGAQKYLNRKLGN